METAEIKSIWKKYDTMIEESKVLNLQSWALNLNCFETLQKQKATSKLKSLILPKIGGIVLGVIWILFVGFIFYHALSQIVMAVSLGMIILLTLIAIVTYIQDITIISQVNYSESITDTQKKIASLQASIVNCIRVLWLQLPFYTTCYISNKLAMEGGIKFWIIQIPITVLFTWIAVFLYKNISLKNMNKKWVKGFINGSGFNQVSKAMEFMNEIDEFKKG